MHTFKTLSVYSIPTDCLCLVDFLLFTFVYVNNGRIHDGSFDLRRKDSELTESHTTRSKLAMWISSLTCSKGTPQKGATMKKIAMYAGLFVVLASPLAASSTTEAQYSTKSDTNAVTITGHVSCSRFGLGSVSPRKGMSVAQTIQYCANFQGGYYTLVSGKQIFRLNGNNDMLAKMSGQTVSVAGRLTQDEPASASYVWMGTLETTTIAPAKN
jgi:hypothetical protein